MRWSGNRRFGAVFCVLLALGVCGASPGAVGDHVYWGQIAQGQVYDDPNLGPLYLVLIEFETDASVEAIEISAPGGCGDIIPGDEYTAYAETETFHWVSGEVHKWEYWGYFLEGRPIRTHGTPGALDEHVGRDVEIKGKLVQLEEHDVEITGVFEIWPGKIREQVA